MKMVRKIKKASAKDAENKGSKDMVAVPDGNLLETKRRTVPERSCNKKRKEIMEEDELCHHDQLQQHLNSEYEENKSNSKVKKDSKSHEKQELKVKEKYYKEIPSDIEGDVQIKRTGKKHTDDKDNKESKVMHCSTRRTRHRNEEIYNCLTGDVTSSVPLAEDTAKSTDVKTSSHPLQKKRQKESLNEAVKTGKRRRRSSSEFVVFPEKGIKKLKECSDKDAINSLVAETDERIVKEECKPCSGSQKYVGAHTSIAGSLCNAIHEALAIGGRAFGLFLKSQRTWNSKPLKDEDAEQFISTLKESGIFPQMVVPHGSYLLNCGSSDAEVLRKSRETLVDELKRCEKLGLPIYNFHPGSSKGEISQEECIKKISETIDYAHSQTSDVITVIENMSCQGNTIGGKFTELRQIIDGVKDKSRMGVCLDTCHAFAAGYDIKSEDGYERMKTEFCDVIGYQYIKAVHLNDSKGELGCHQDRHENIGKGKLGLATFRRIMNDPFFDNIPMILETPEGDYAKEIRKLYQLVNQ